MPQSSAKDHRIRRRHSRFAVGFFILLFLVSIITGYAIYQQLVTGEERQNNETLNDIADIQANAVSAWVQERLSDAAVFSSGGFLGEAINTWIRQGGSEDEMKSQLRDQLLAIKKNYGYLEAAILDTNGNVRITTRDDGAPLDPVAQKAVQNAVATNSTQVSQIHTVNDVTYGGGRLIDIATPLLDIHERTQKIPSILLLRAGTDSHIASFSQSMPFTNVPTEVLLVQIEDGAAVTAAASDTSKNFAYRDVLPVTLKELEMDATPTPSHLRIRGPSGQELNAVARKISGVPWYLMAMVDRQAASAELRRWAWIVFGTWAGVLTLLGTALLLWWRERESEFRLQSYQTAAEKTLLQRQYNYLSKYANDIIIMTNANGHIVEVNDRAVQVFGKDRSALTQVRVESFFAPSAAQTIKAALHTLLHSDIAMFEAEITVENGACRSIEVSARAIGSGSDRRIQMICRDVTERKQTEAALQENRDRLNGILASIHDVVWSFSPDMSQLHYINQSAETVYGRAISEFMEAPSIWLNAIVPDDRVRVEATLHALTPAQPMWDIEFRIIHQNGEVRWLHCRGQLVFDEHGKPLRIDGVTTDVTQRKDAEEQVQALAYYDNVTKLPNRALLHDRLNQAMSMAARSQKRVALLFMDLDNFKNINDSLGHQIGDMLLRDIAERLQQCVRGEDTVARIGGDEFLVVLPDIDKGAQAVPVAEKILSTTARPFTLKDHQIYTTISIGISVFPDDAQELHELIRHADSALYQAKSHGRDNYQFFTPELNYQITRSSNIERQLRHAIESGQLCLWYQPQIDTKEGKLIGAEALLRWRQHGRDVLSPVEFIPVAEERGLIGKIGEWVMREACRQCRRWQVQGFRPVPIAVNVSPIQFQQKGFAELVTSILEETGLDPTYLELEITESSIMRRAPLVADLAMRLREVGVGISIDDFGTGYSSLSYLKQIPLDKIKIDRSFISDMLDDADDNAITYAIVNLAHSLNLRVIAEGVESKEQMERLRAFGCDEVQGNYYSSPVSPQTFESFLSNEQSFLHAADLKP